jgi:hypothetical protein
MLLPVGALLLRLCCRLQAVGSYASPFPTHLPHQSNHSTHSPLLDIEGHPEPAPNWRTAFTGQPSQVTAPTRACSSMMGCMLCAAHPVLATWCWQLGNLVPPTAAAVLATWLNKLRP